MLQHIPFPALPAPPSWFPGHMNQFRRQLPVLLKQTDVVLELRDARLPLTSINRTFEGLLALILIPILQSGRDGQDVVATKQLPGCGERVLWCLFCSTAVQFLAFDWSCMVRANPRRWYLSTRVSRVTLDYTTVITMGDEGILCLHTPSLLASTKPLSPKLTKTFQGPYENGERSV